MDEVNDILNIHVDKKTNSKYLYFIIKRIFDIFVSLVGILFLIPITIVIKICYLMTGDFHSIFFSQERIGRNGKKFKLYKFRTMVVNADEVLKSMIKEDKKIAEEYKINKKIKNDPRITKFGSIVRKLSIDELPQVVNILKGDMSFIGNRPYLPRERKEMAHFDEITKLKPGLTGYWQVNGRSNTTFKERLILERYYSNHYSLIMDVKIFLKTFKVVIFGRDVK